ncbi:hypothetical protein COCON_G00096830 [Conger conger]|uniref:Uncharacterized protein n=1 Tax=Conger conger TaxID=82655 RepID=A0A9Q1DM81_CONCO|nr:hypothetical protein COCON_G00096830 [Conger conger]
MDLRVTSVILLLLALAEGHGERYISRRAKPHNTKGQDYNTKGQDYNTKGQEYNTKGQEHNTKGQGAKSTTPRAKLCKYQGHKAPQVNQDTRDPLALLGPQDRVAMDVQDLKANKDHLDHLVIPHPANQGAQVDQGKVVQWARLATGASRVHLDLRDPGVCQAPMGALDQQVSPLLANLDLMACRGQWGLEVSQVRRDPLVCLVSQVQREKGDMAFLEHQVKEVPLGQWVLLGNPASQELGSQVPPDTRGSLGNPVDQAVMGLLDPWEFLGKRVHPGLQEWECLGNQVLMVLQECLDLLDTKVFLDHLAYLEHLAYQVVENQAHLEFVGIEEFQVPLVLWVRRENQDPQVTLGIQVLLALWVQLALRVQEGFRVSQERKDPKAQWAQGELLDLKVIKVRVAAKVHLVVPVALDQQGLKVTQGAQENLGKGGIMDSLGQEDPVGQQVQQDYLVEKVTQVLLGLLAHQA